MGISLCYHYFRIGRVSRSDIASYSYMAERIMGFHFIISPKLNVGGNVFMLCIGLG